MLPERTCQSRLRTVHAASPTRPTGRDGRCRLAEKLPRLPVTWRVPPAAARKFLTLVEHPPIPASTKQESQAFSCLSMDMGEGLPVPWSRRCQQAQAWMLKARLASSERRARCP